MATSESHVSDTGQVHGHVIPLRTYFAVYGALVVFTVLTVGVSYANLGAASIYVAMLVAIVKASLVVAYFMHLKYDSPFNALVFLVSLLFLALFFSFTMIDIASRDSITNTEGNFQLRSDRAAASAKAAAAAAPKSSSPTPASAPVALSSAAPASAPAGSSAAPASASAPVGSSTAKAPAAVSAPSP